MHRTNTVISLMLQRSFGDQQLLLMKRYPNSSENENRAGKLAYLGGYIQLPYGLKTGITQKIEDDHKVTLQLNALTTSPELSAYPAILKTAGLNAIVQHQSHSSEEEKVWINNVNLYVRDNTIPLNIVDGGKHLEWVDINELTLQHKYDEELINPVIKYLALHLRSQALAPASFIKIPDIINHTGPGIEGIHANAINTHLSKPNEIPVIGSVIYNPDLKKYLLQQCGRPQYDLQWSLLGGKVDPGESYKIARIREVVEEEYGKKNAMPEFVKKMAKQHNFVGYIGMWGTIIKPGMYATNIIPFISTQLTNFSPEHAESAELKYFSLDEIKELSLRTPDTLEAITLANEALKTNMFYRPNLVMTENELYDMFK